MVESAPLFIEYCCTDYVHFDAVKLLLFVVFVLIPLAGLITDVSWYFFRKRKSEK